MGHDPSFSSQIGVGLFLSVQLLLILDLDVMDLPLLILLHLPYDLFKLPDLLLCILLALRGTNEGQLCFMWRPPLTWQFPLFSLKLLPLTHLSQDLSLLLQLGLVELRQLL